MIETTTLHRDNLPPLIVHQLFLPLYYGYAEDCALDDADLALLPGETEEVWYWYQAAEYEGYGEMVARVGDLYEYDSLGHCSCFGPMGEYPESERTFVGEPLDALIARMSDELRSEKNLQTLIGVVRTGAES